MDKKNESVKIGIMQPYFFPYIGYWQLLNAVDKYVIYDDVNFIKGGWINRNRILINGNPTFFNVPMIEASSFKLINEIRVNKDERLLNKNLKTIYEAYKKAPYFAETYPLIEKILTNKEDNLAMYVATSIREIAKYLDMPTEIYVSSELSKDNSLRGQDRVIAICKCLGGTEYYNAFGGQELYDYNAFEKNDLQLSFVETNRIVYNQFKNEFIPGLSIIDVLMFNGKEKTKILLEEYNLINNRKGKQKILK